MKKILPVILCLALLAGCAATGTPSEPATPDAPETPVVTDTETAAYQSLGLSQEDALGAVAFLGGFGEDSDAALQKEAFSGIGAVQSFDLSGEETYLIVPRYEGETITITEMKMDETTAEITATENVNTVTDTAVTVRCNPSDLYSNVQITLDYNGDMVTFSPFISLMDGSVATDARVPVVSAE